jgi:hypothetical protein
LSAWATLVAKDNPTPVALENWKRCLIFGDLVWMFSR